jgi:hypothetical protein
MGISFMAIENNTRQSSIDKTAIKPKEKFVNDSDF